MRIKLDENFGTSIQRICQNAGHDTQTVHDEKIAGCSDQTLYEICCSEKRCLVTLDLDFSNIMHFIPERTVGIVIIRSSKNANFAILKDLVEQFLKVADRMPVARQLWIVEPGRIRIHQRK